MNTNYAELWRQDGCLVIPQAFPPGRIAALGSACEGIYRFWKESSTEEGEPAGYCYKPSAWCLFHINHPRYHRGRPGQLADVLEAAAEPLVITLLREIFQDEVAPLQINLYIDPPGPGPGNPANWHRDSQFSPDHAPGDEAERELVLKSADPPRALHMHIPLVPTSASEVVPGSHRRWDTPEELFIRLHDQTSETMPGARRLPLEPGDIAFFHVNALHRGRYTPGVPRRTIAITYGALSQPRFATAEIMRENRGYVPSYQPWYLHPEYLQGISPYAKEFYGRFVDTYRESWKPEFATPELLGPALSSYFNPHYSPAQGICDNSNHHPGDAVPNETSR